MRVINITAYCKRITDLGNDYPENILLYNKEYCILDDNKDSIDILHEEKENAIEHTKEYIDIENAIIVIEAIERDIDWYINLRDLDPKYIQDLRAKDKDGNFKYLHEFKYTYYPLTDMIFKDGVFGYRMRKYGVKNFKIPVTIAYSGMNLKHGQTIKDIQIGSIVSVKSAYTGDIEQYVVTTMLSDMNGHEIYINMVTKTHDTSYNLFYPITDIVSIDGIDNESIQWLRDKGYLETEEG